jgi:hypothetical protein
LLNWNFRLNKVARLKTMAFVNVIFLCCFVALGQALVGIYIDPEIIEGYKNGTYKSTQGLKRSLYDTIENDPEEILRRNLFSSGSGQERRRNTRVPEGTPLFGKRQIPEYCIAKWGAEIRVPYQDPIPLWQDYAYLEIKDTDNQRFVARLDSPNGPVGQWTTQQGTWSLSSGTCIYYATAIFGGPLDYLDIARNTLVKVGEINKNKRIDVYRGTVREPTVDYHQIAKYVHINSKTNATLYEEWIQDIARPKNPDGSCPFNLGSFAGNIIYEEECSNLNDEIDKLGQDAIETLFALPPACLENAVPSTALCWG